MREFSVYLRGPITGLSGKDAFAWRDHVAKRFAEINKKYIPRGVKLIAVSPMAAEHYLRSMDCIPATCDDKPLSTAKGIVKKDWFYIEHCDFTLANFLGAGKVSVGSVSEGGFEARGEEGKALTVLVIEEKGNPHDNIFVDQEADFRFTDLDEAVNAIARLTAAFLDPPKEPYTDEM